MLEAKKLTFAIFINSKKFHDELKSAKEKIDKIRERISSGEITFSDAALRFSDEKQTRLNEECSLIQVLMTQDLS